MRKFSKTEANHKEQALYKIYTYIYYIRVGEKVIGGWWLKEEWKIYQFRFLDDNNFVIGFLSRPHVKLTEEIYLCFSTQKINWQKENVVGLFIMLTKLTLKFSC